VFLSGKTSSPVEPSQVQTLTDKLIAANLITRIGHGKCAVADPFVRSVWAQRAALELPGGSDAEK
jgi:hypothetical protein